MDRPTGVTAAPSIKPPSGGLLYLAGLSMLAGAGYLLWESICPFCDREVPDLTLVSAGLVVASVVTALSGRSITIRPLVYLAASAAITVSVAIGVVGLWADLIEIARDPYGFAPGSYFPNHGTWLAVIAGCWIGVPALVAQIGSRPTGSTLRGRSGPGLPLALGLALGVALLAMPGLRPSADENVRLVVSTRHGYTAVLPPAFNRVGTHGLQYGQRWELPRTIDWFGPGNGYSGEVQLSVWSTPVPSDVSLDEFVDVQVAADQAMGLAGPTSREPAMVAGRPATMLRYRARPAERISGPSYWLFGYAEITDLWTDCRFMLPDARDEVDVARIVGLASGRGFVVSVYAVPTSAAMGGRLLAIFAAQMQPTLSTPPAVRSEMFAYPPSDPLTSTSDDC